MATSQIGTEGTASEKNGNAATDFDFGLPRKIRALEAQVADRAALWDSRLSNKQKKSKPDGMDFFWRSERDLIAFSPLAKKEVSLGQALASSTPVACCISLFKSLK